LQGRAEAPTPTTHGIVDIVESCHGVFRRCSRRGGWLGYDFRLPNRAARRDDAVEKCT
jgi:hypothetical protein